MSTLTVMKARIADEIARSDLTNAVATAISTAIGVYQSERFSFNESRALTFSTVTNQEFYTSSTNTNLPTLQSIDYLTVLIGGIPQELKRRTEIEIEIDNQNGTLTGQPLKYAYYNRTLRIGPVPDTAYTIRVAARVQLAEPATDGETDNPWMIEAEKLIRSQAKYELYTHVLRNPTQAAVMKAEAEDEFSGLKGKTNRLAGTNIIRPMQF